MALVFSTFVTVPSEIIENFGNRLKDEIISKLKSRGGFTNKQLVIIQDIISHEVHVAAQHNVTTVDGHLINNKSRMIISKALASGQRVDAIREFRSATGEGLRDAKNFMDNFSSGNEGAIEFMSAFT